MDNFSMLFTELIEFLFEVILWLIQRVDGHDFLPKINPSGQESRSILLKQYDSHPSHTSDYRQASEENSSEDPDAMPESLTRSCLRYSSGFGALVLAGSDTG